jgi:PAS domain S-box-containing protein
MYGLEGYAVDVRMAIVAPYPGLRETAAEVIRENMFTGPASIDLLTGDLAEGLTQAKQAVATGAEVIISRGGTASLIAKKLDVLLVEIEVNPIDILRALSKIENPIGPIGVIGFRNVIYGCEEISRVIGVPLLEISLDNETEAEEKIRAAARQGIRSVVGDAISIKSAVRLGLDAIMIESGKEAISKAIREALKIVAVRRREQERAELITTLIATSTDALVAVDRQSCITLFNPLAETLFSRRASEVMGRPIHEVLADSRLPKVMETRRQEWAELERVDGRVLASKLTPILIRGEVAGALATYQDVTQVQRFEQSIRQKLYAKGLVAKTQLADFITLSQQGKALLEKARQFAAVDSNILITGETGTGKEMIAQGLHNLSRRAKGPFVAFNCAAVPENLLESELFGYEEGAFTGARRGGKVGLIELAHGGTLFMDEIGEMPLPLQARVLRVIQEKEVMRIGGERIIPVDLRLLSATNENLGQLIEQRKFRKDLYYRINVLRLHIPPLRDRPEDIPLLVQHILKRHQAMNPAVTEIGAKAMKRLWQQEWSGNVRELESTLERALLLAKGPVVQEEDILEALFLHAAPELPPECGLGEAALRNVEKVTIERVLQEEKFNYSRAAARLGINRTTLWRKRNK